MEKAEPPMPSNQQTLPVRAVIFDMGGVLAPDADYSPIFRRQSVIVDRASLKTLKKSQWNLARVTPAYPLEQYWQPILEALGLPAEEWSQIDQEVRDLFVPWWQMFALVDKLRSAGLRVGIISNHICAWFDHWFSRFGLDALFNEPELVVVSSRLGLAKPDRPVFERYCELTGLAASECIFIDNQINNVEAARGAGWAAVHFQHRDKEGQLIETPDALLEKLRAHGIEIP